MDTEQLKLILETLKTAGDGAYDVAVWYLVCQAMVPIVTAVLTLAGVLGALVIIKAIIMNVFMGSSACWEMALRLGVDIAPGPWIAGDTRKCMRRIDDLLKKERQCDGNK